ncbi:MAG: helix-turn-helix transcriptional regulator [Cyanobacteria bacterium J06634_5]
MPLTQKSKVAELRDQTGLTQVQLAALVGVTPNTIQNWEKPDGLKSLERYLKMAELFGCPVEELVEYVPADESEQSNTGNKVFSLEDVRELRKRWGSEKKTTPRNQKGKKSHSSSIKQADEEVHEA